LLSTSFFATVQPLRGGEPGTGQFLETCLGLRHGRGIGRIELVPRIASVIHYDLCCHRALLARFPNKLRGRHPFSVGWTSRKRNQNQEPGQRCLPYLLGAHGLAPSVVKSAFPS